MSSIMARSGVDEIKEKLCDLSKDLDKYAPEHRSQVMVDRLRQQKLRAMISLAKAQQFLAETDVLIADYNLQAVADEFEHMKNERFNINTDMRPPQNSHTKEEKLVSSTDFPANSRYPEDVFSCTPLLHAIGHSRSKEKGTELTPKLSTQHAHRSKSKTDACHTSTSKCIQPINKISYSEPTTKINEPKSKSTETSSKSYEPIASKTYKESSSKTKEAATSKTYETSSSRTKETGTSKMYEPSSSKTKETATSKTYEPPSSKTKEPAISKTSEPSSKAKEPATVKTYEPSSSKNKETATSKTYEATTSTKEAALADTDLPAPGLERKKRKRNKSKSKESKRHKSSHDYAASSHAPAASSHAPAASSHAPAASSRVPAASSHAPAASSNVPKASHGPVVTSHAPAASSNVNTASHGSPESSLMPAASSHLPVASSHLPVASSHVHALLHVPNCDCPKSNRTDKVKTLLNTSISPIKKIVAAKRVQTDEKIFKSDIVQTDEVKTLTKGVQTDNVIILHVGSETVTENSPIIDEETLLLDTLPVPHSHSTAISLAKALQQIKNPKTSVLERLCPEPDVSEVLSQNAVLRKLELIIDDEAETVEESAVVKTELLDHANTSTEVLVNNLFKDIMKANNKETEDIKPKGKLTKKGLRRIIDKC